MKKLFLLFISQRLITLRVTFFILPLFLLSACGAAKTPAPAIPAATPALTMAVVAQHNTADNCWLVINNNIYNVTDYIPNYPGGGQAITALCGKDATVELVDAWKNSPSGDSDRQVFEQYYIGDLVR